MTRSRVGGRRREREGVEKKSGAKREEEEKKFQIVVWRERLRNVGLVA